MKSQKENKSQAQTILTSLQGPPMGNFKLICTKIMPNPRLLLFHVQSRSTLFFCRLYSKSQKCRVVEKYPKVMCSNDKVVVDALISLPSIKWLQMSEFSTARAKRDVVQQFHSLEKDNRYSIPSISASEARRSISIPEKFRKKVTLAYPSTYFFVFHVKKWHKYIIGTFGIWTLHFFGSSW